MDLSHYNDEQKEAILDTVHNEIILSVAGSGKTTTIIGKIAYEISEGIVQPEDICAVTFTNKAADEMRDRLKQLIGDRWKRVTVRTFHSLGVMLLRRFAAEAKLEDTFSIATDPDVKFFIQQAVGCDDKEADRLATAVLNVKEFGYNPNSKEAAAFFLSFDNPYEIIKAYEIYKNSQNALDFPDLILRLVQLLRNSETVRTYCHERYKLVIVDEYQDSNVMQSRFLKLFVGPKSRVVVVGDDDQSIYAFRGAEVRNILAFPVQFPNVRKIELLKNYRSTSEILAAASSVIVNNTERYPKDIISALDRHGVKPYRMKSRGGTEEANAIADIIKESGDYASFAVLYRKHRTANILRRVLIQNNIPFVTTGGVGVLESSGVKAAVALLRLCFNHRDSVALNNIIRKCRIGLGTETVKKILDAAASDDGDLLKACTSLVNSSGTAVRKEKLALFIQVWKRAEKAVLEPADTETALESAAAATRELENVSTGEIIRDCLLKLGIREVGKPAEEEENGTKSEDEKDDVFGVYADMINNRRNFYDAELLGKNADVPDERDILQCFIIRSELGDDAGQDKAIGAVTLSSMHAAKGLEFTNVFVIGLEDDNVPGKEATGRGIDEERRIFYVAMTRAKNLLWLCSREIDGTAFASKGGMKFFIESRFLSEIPADALVEYKPSPARRAAVQGTSFSYSKGDRIHHDDRGDGTVTDVVRQADKTILAVRFDSSGAVIKLFANHPKIAPLAKEA